MKYVLYIISAVIAILLFLPTTDGKQIRNLPLLIALLAMIGGFLLWQLLRRAAFMLKVKKALKKGGCEIIKSGFNPFAARLNGRYSVTFKAKDKTVTALLLMCKRKYQRYHFESAYHLEFYRSNRVAFNSTKTYGAKISNLVEIKKVGDQSLKWEEADCNIVIFDKIPDHITDSKQKELLGKGDKVCGSETYISDLEVFSEYLIEN